MVAVNANNAFNFSPAQIDRMRESAMSLNKFSEEHFDILMQTLQSSGTVGVNGIGSLISYSHLEENGDWKDSFKERFPALAAMEPHELFKVHQSLMTGWKRNFCCRDIHYRGTPENPGITIGLQRVEDEQTFGGYLETDLRGLGMSEEMATEFMCYYFEEFNRREAPPNMPIYKFVVEEIKVAGGQTRMALCCVADEDGPLYEPDLTEEEIALIIATHRGAGINDKGQPKKRGFVTNLDYLKGLMADSQKYGILVEDHLVRILNMATAFRLQLSNDKRIELERHEKAGEGANTVPLNTRFAVEAVQYTVVRRPELEEALGLN